MHNRAKMSSGENTPSSVDSGAGLRRSILSAIKNASANSSLQDSRESSFDKSRNLTSNNSSKSTVPENNEATLNSNPLQEPKGLDVIIESSNSSVSDLKTEIDPDVFKDVPVEMLEDILETLKDSPKKTHRKSSSIDLGTIGGDVIELKDHNLQNSKNESTSPKKAISLDQVNCVTKEHSLPLSSKDLKTIVTKRSDSLISSVGSKDKDSIAEIPFAVCSKALYACVNGEIDEIRDLINENPNLLNYAYPFCYRYTCLHMAAKSRNTSLVHWLVNKGANLNSKDDNWSTALHLAAQAGDLNMVKLLCELGVDPEILDGHGKSYKNYLPNAPMSIKKNLNFEEKNDLSNNAASSSFSTLTNSFSRYGSLRVIKRAAKDLFVFPGAKR